MLQSFKTIFAENPQNMARGKRDAGHFSELWRFCTLTPPDLEFITKVLKDNFHIHPVHLPK